MEKDSLHRVVRIERHNLYETDGMEYKFLILKFNGTLLALSSGVRATSPIPWKPGTLELQSC